MSIRRKDDSGLARSKLPPVPDPIRTFYHWSPSRNRKQIEKVGLLTHRISNMPGWKWRPPYVCFSDNPMMAWSLSGDMYPEIKSWDLWVCYPDVQTSFEGWEVVTDTYPRSGETFVKEYRVYSRVYKRDLKYVATRTQ